MSLTNRDPLAAVPTRLSRWLLFLLARVNARSHAAFQDALVPLGLRPKSFGALTVIVEQGPLSQSALGETLLIVRTTIVAVIDELERSGYVERRRSAVDRRIHSLEATPAGKNALRAAERIGGRTHDELLANLSAEEREQLRALLARIA